MAGAGQLTADSGCAQKIEGPSRICGKPSRRRRSVRASRRIDRTPGAGQTGKGGLLQWRTRIHRKAVKVRPF